ncbi:hypothetical protein C2E23DRAFT_421473 [Lenzites betulinus]|nr:hypothetical protein C2E23DRAFT_421473 [Lenzites betulinus]
MNTRLSRRGSRELWPTSYSHSDPICLPHGARGSSSSEASWQALLPTSHLEAEPVQDKPTTTRATSTLCHVLNNRTRARVVHRRGHGSTVTSTAWQYESLLHTDGTRDDVHSTRCVPVLSPSSNAGFVRAVSDVCAPLQIVPVCCAGPLCYPRHTLSCPDRRPRCPGNRGTPSEWSETASYPGLAVFRRPSLLYTPSQAFSASPRYLHVPLSLWNMYYNRRGATIA